MSQAQLMTNFKSFANGIIQSYEESGPIAQSNDLATKSFLAANGWTSKTAAKDARQSFQLNGHGLSHIYNKTTTHPEYFERVSGRLGKMASVTKVDKYQKDFAFNVYPLIVGGLPTSTIAMENPFWQRERVRYGSSTLSMAPQLQQGEGPVPFANNNLEQISAAALNENFKKSANNPLSNTFALLHQTNDLMARQQQDLHNARATALEKQLNDNMGQVSTYTQQQQNYDATHPLDAGAAGRKPDFMPPPPSEGPHVGIDDNAPDRVKAKNGTTINPKTGEHAPTGQWWVKRNLPGPNGKIDNAYVLVNKSGRTKETRRDEREYKRLRTAGQDITYAGMALGAVALAATGVGLVADAALFGAAAASSGAWATASAAGYAGAAVGAAGAATQSAGTYPDPYATKEMKHAAMVNNITAGVGVAAAGAGAAYSAYTAANEAATTARVADQGIEMTNMGTRAATRTAINDLDDVFLGQKATDLSDLQEAFPPPVWDDPTPPPLLRQPRYDEGVAEWLNADNTHYQPNNTPRGFVHNQSQIGGKINNIVTVSRVKRFTDAAYMSVDDANQEVGKMGFFVNSDLSTDETMVFANKNKNVVISHRGSDFSDMNKRGWKDLYDDSRIYGGLKATRTQRALATTQKVALYYDMNIADIEHYGYSLGGPIANDIAIETGAEAHILNPHMPKANTRIGPKTTIWRTKGDFASNAIRNRQNVRTILSPIKLEKGVFNPIRQHMLEFLEDDLVTP